MSQAAFFGKVSRRIGTLAPSWQTRPIRLLFAAVAVLGISGCGVAYVSPTVTEEVTDAGVKVRVVPLTTDTAIAANRSPYSPRPLPSDLGLAQASTVRPIPASAGRLPPSGPAVPYTIGVGDVLVLATPTSASTVEQLSGLLAAQSARQGYTVQDDGAISVPNVGRVRVAGMSLEAAEAALFRHLVEAGIEPTFTVEIAEFRSKRVEVGGAVAAPAVLPIGLAPLTLSEAILLSGGLSVTDPERARVQLVRGGATYSVPASALYDDTAVQGFRLQDGDRVLVLAGPDPDRARAGLMGDLDLLSRKLDLDAVERDYVYLAGEVGQQARVALPFGRPVNLADVLYGEGGFAISTGNPREIYVLRGSPNPAEFNGLTAFHLDAENAANLLLATRFEMRPNDIVFISEQPVTRWNRALSLIVPGALGAAAARNL